ncbi:Uma2 family endonuclease [Sulfurihydrogenibium azorense]|uniref:Uma2 family endonuclease n=1 Tax=Sulfurihydrogenibium azorense TaxID=309806 RepID=UPI0024091D0A|nr:Uma2 family endonuclease [Sulfurihydrogenibium azorense]MDM7273131.1 Uma2 family endonuclease [Sulfurihydrogenibium azorense]
MGYFTDKYLPYYTIEERDRWEGDWELVEGIPYALTSSSVVHQETVVNIVYQIKSQLLNCGEECKVIVDIDYYISKDTVVRPDVVIVCQKIEDRLTVVPDVVFEVVSPSSVKMDEHIKYQIYQQEKVKYYILVYPQDLKKIKVYKLDKDGYKKEFEGFEGNYQIDLEKCKINLDVSKII